MRVVFTVLIGVGALCAVEPVSAGEEVDAQARALFQEGVDLFRAKRFEEANTAFREAQRLKPSWKLEFNIGQSEAALKRYGLAIESFERYLNLGGDEVPTDRRDLVLGELERMRKLVGVLELEGPEGSQVYVDGVLRGEMPIPSGIQVTAGVPHGLRVVRSDQVLMECSVTVRGGMTATFEVGEEPEGDGPVKEGDDRVEEGDGLQPMYFWIGVGTTAALGVGLVSVDLALGAKLDDPGYSQADESGAQGLKVTGIVLLGATCAAAVTTGILGLLTDFGKEEEDAALGLAPWVAPTSGGVSLTGRF